MQKFHGAAPNQFLAITGPARLRVFRPGVCRVQSCAGMAFEIRASIDLKQWAPVTTVAKLTGALEVTDPAPANPLRRFSRAVLE